MNRPATASESQEFQRESTGVRLRESLPHESDAGVPDLFDPELQPFVEGLSGYTAEQHTFLEHLPGRHPDKDDPVRMSLVVLFRDRVAKIALTHNINSKALKKGNILPEEREVGVFTENETVDYLAFKIRMALMDRIS